MNSHTVTAAPNKGEDDGGAASQLIRDSRDSKLTDETAKAQCRRDEPGLLEAQLQIIGQIVRKHPSKHEDARHRAHQADHAQHDISILQDFTISGVSFSVRYSTDCGSALRVLRLAKNQVKQSSHDEARDGHYPEHHAPRCEFEKLRRDDGSQTEAEEGESALLQALEESAPRGIRCRGCRGETRGTVRSLHQSHETSNDHETCQSRDHSGKTRHQGEAENCRDENLAVAHSIGDSPADGGEYAPDNPDHGNEISDRLIAQPRPGAPQPGATSFAAMQGNSGAMIQRSRPTRPKPRPSSSTAFHS
jgi:hypothetical protein